MDDPDGESDNELIGNINSIPGNHVCLTPTDIDARLTNGDHYTTASQDVHISVLDGFICYNTDDQTCCDYKVRFCCPKSKY